MLCQTVRQISLQLLGPILPVLDYSTLNSRLAAVTLKLPTWSRDCDLSWLHLNEQFIGQEMNLFSDLIEECGVLDVLMATQ